MPLFLLMALIMLVIILLATLIIVLATAVAASASSYYSAYKRKCRECSESKVENCLKAGGILFVEHAIAEKAGQHKREELLQLHRLPACVWALLSSWQPGCQ